MNFTPPIFQPVFREQWPSLPPVMHKHYANRPFSTDKVTVNGRMTVEISPLAQLLSPLMRMTGTLPPYAGRNIPVTVHFDSERDSNAFCFNRIFNFPGKRPYRFRSRMLPVGGNEVIEFMPLGIGWHASYQFDGRKILIKHIGYKIKLFGRLIRLPLEIVLGKGYAEEEALNDNSFRMYMDIRHRLFGKIYGYSGEFGISEVKLHA